MQYSELEILEQNIDSATAYIEEHRELCGKLGLNTEMLVRALKSLSSAKKIHNIVVRAYLELK